MSKLAIAKEAASRAFADETLRGDGLSRDAWKFCLGILLVTGFQLREVKALVESPLPAVKILCCLSFLCLSAALVAAVYGMQCRSPGQFPRGLKLWESLKPEQVLEREAEEACVQMLLQAREQNARANDAKARALRWCGWLFLGGVLLVILSQVLDAFENWT